MKKRKKGGNWLAIALTVLIGFGAVAGVFALSNEESTNLKESTSEVELIQVFEDIPLTDDISTYNKFNATRGAYMYQNRTYFANSTIKKIGVPVMSISDYTKDNIFTIYVVNFDSIVAKGTKYLSKHELVIKANTYSSNIVNKWVYFDVNINIGKGETLAFVSAEDNGDTVFAGYPSTTLSLYTFYLDVMNGSSVIASDGNILFDVYKEA